MMTRVHKDRRHQKRPTQLTEPDPNTTEAVSYREADADVRPWRVRRNLVALEHLVGLDVVNDGLELGLAQRAFRLHLK